MRMGRVGALDVISARPSPGAEASGGDHRLQTAHSWRQDGQVALDPEISQKIRRALELLEQSLAEELYKKLLLTQARETAELRGERGVCWKLAESVR